MNSQSNQICTTNAKQQAEAGALLVDVREACDAHALALDAPEVLNLPLSVLGSRWQELPSDRELVTVCQTGEQSQIASQFLLSKGLDDAWRHSVVDAEGLSGDRQTLHIVQ